MVFFLIDKVCTPEEIERKRLLALQRRQQAQLKAQIMPKDSPTQLKAQITPKASPAYQQSKLNNSRNVARQNKSNNRFNPIEPRNFFSSTSIVTGKCYMISDDRFALETSSFVPAIIEIFKTIPNRIYGNYKLIDLKDLIYEFMIFVVLINM